MSKEPAEIFERAADDGFIAQVCSQVLFWEISDWVLIQLKHHSVVSQYGQLSGALKLDGVAVRSHFKEILYNQVFVFPVCNPLANDRVWLQILNGKFCKEFSSIEADLEKEGSANPLNELYRKTEATELVQAEKRVRSKLADLL